MKAMSVTQESSRDRPARRAASPLIAFSWDGLPQYAARLIRAAVERLEGECAVVGSPPLVPVRGMEEVLGCPVHWVDIGKPGNWRALGLGVPRIFFQSGWSYPAFSSLGAEVKAQGGRVIGLSDANWRGDLRQLLAGPIAFRALHRRRFDAMIVPGRQGERLMRWFGMPAGKVRSGMYGADPAVFGNGPLLPSRPRTFLFVGQFIARKNVLGLARAFQRFCETRSDWTLHLCGSGEQKALIPRHARIVQEDFIQPQELAKRFHAARFLVLPSLLEAWGLVVHEAALSGCGLVLSDAIGSGDDLAGASNSVRFRAKSEDDLLRALHAAAAFDDAMLRDAESESLVLARRFGPERFSAVIAGLVEQFAGDAVHPREP